MPVLRRRRSQIVQNLALALIAVATFARSARQRAGRDHRGSVHRTLVVLLHPHGSAPAARTRWIIKRVAAVPRDTVDTLAAVPEDRIPPGKLVLLGHILRTSADRPLPRPSRCWARRCAVSRAADRPPVLGSLGSESGT